MEEIHKQIKPKMEALHEETKQKLSTVLNNEQLNKFNELSEKRHQRMQERMKKMREKHTARSADGGHDETDYCHP